MSSPSFPHHHICHCISCFAWHCLTFCTPVKFIDAFPTLTHTDCQTTNWLRQDRGVSWSWWVYASISAAFIADGCFGIERALGLCFLFRADTSMATILSNGTSTSLVLGSPVWSFVKIWQDRDWDQSSQVEEPWKTGLNRHQPVQCSFGQFFTVERPVSTSLSLNWLRTGWGLVEDQSC